MRRVLFLSWIAAGCLSVGAVAQNEYPMVFDHFQSSFESRSGWQSFRAAHAFEIVKDHPKAGPHALKVKARFSEENKEATLIWRFPDVQFRKFRARVMMPEQPNTGDVFFRLLTNDTRGDAYFFQPYVDGSQTKDLACLTQEGVQMQPASPLQIGQWVNYEVSSADNIFYHQSKKKPAHEVQDFALMNTARDSLNLSEESRPAMEAAFIVFQIPAGSPLIGKEVEFYLDFVEI